MDKSSSLTMRLYRGFKRQKGAFGAFLALTVIAIIIYLMSISWIQICWDPETPTMMISRTSFDPFPSFPEEWYTIICFNNLKQHTIKDLDNNLKLWEAAEDRHCRELYSKFSTIYTIERSSVEVEIPPSFETKIFKWFGNNSDAINWVKKQVVYHVTNNYSHQRTIHAPLRAKRPGIDSHEGALVYIMKTANETQKHCDFCNFKSATACDTFGRHETELSFTASNVFKLNRWHGLICPKKHNVLNLTADDVVDMFIVAQRWFESAHALNNEYRYPMLNWDSTPHAGASQFHPHLQAFLSSSGYYGVMDTLCRAASQYARDHKASNYFSDLISLHHLLGLSVNLGNATALIELSERGDSEITILSREPGIDMYLLLFYVIRTYVEELGIYAFSAGIAFPNMKHATSPGSLPALIKITTRGDVNNFFSDISGFDLYLSPNTSRDPYALIDKLKKTIDKYEKGDQGS